MRLLSFLSVPVLAILALGFASCNKDDNKDTTKPDITLHGPEEGAKLVINRKSGVHFEADFGDAKGLKSYRIDIHSNFDNHGHASTGSTVDIPIRHGNDEGEAWSFQKEWPLEGRARHIHHHEIKIEEKDGKKIKPGKYHFVVYCMDINGNERHVYRNVELVREDGHTHGTEAHFHIHTMPTNGSYEDRNLITVEIEGHSEADPVKSIRVVLLPTNLVDKSEKEWQAATTPEACFAVMGEIENANGAKELEIEATIRVGVAKDNHGGKEKGKALTWAKGKYRIYAVGETVGGTKFYLPTKHAKVIEIK
ncbi:MAG: DUF4625 domain-containing protein [Bacteroides sp.]